MVRFHNYLNRLFNLLILVACFAYCLLVAIPTIVYSQNNGEFTSGLLNLFSHFGPEVIVCLLAFVIFLALLPTTFQNIVILFLSVILLLVYIQSSFLSWDYGPFTGIPIKWEKYVWWGRIDVAVWFLVIFGALMFRRFLIKNIKALLVFFVVVFTLSAFVSFINGNAKLFSERAETRSDSIFKFSQEKNVLFIIYDSFSSPAFEAVLEENQIYKQDLSDFTFFRNTLASFPTTAASIPAILTGSEYDNSIPYKDFLTDTLPTHSLPSVLFEKGFQVDVMSLPQMCSKIKGSCHVLNRVVERDVDTSEIRELLELLDVSFFRALPQALKKLVYNNEKWFFQRIFGEKTGPRYLINSVQFHDLLVSKMVVSSDKPTFKFLHFLLPHPPNRLDDNCNVVDKKNNKRKATYQQQASCTVKLLVQVINSLKRIGIYENTLIIVAADHGYAKKYLPVSKTKKLPSLEQAIPLLAIKLFGKSESNEIKISNTPAKLIDIPHTLLTALNIESVFPNEDIFSLPEETKRSRLYRNYGWRTKYWGKQYLPKMYEYLIQGDVRDPESWTSRGPVG